MTPATSLSTVLHDGDFAVAKTTWGCLSILTAVSVWRFTSRRLLPHGPRATTSKTVSHTHTHTHTHTYIRMPFRPAEPWSLMHLRGWRMVRRGSFRYLEAEALQHEMGPSHLCFILLNKWQSYTILPTQFSHEFELISFYSFLLVAVFFFSLSLWKLNQWTNLSSRYYILLGISSSSWCLKHCHWTKVMHLTFIPSCWILPQSGSWS